jgi:hypothetical protein
MKTLKIGIVCFIIFCSNIAAAQNFSWMNSAGGSFDDLSGKVIRGTSNFYLYGNFEGNVTLNNTQSGTPIQLINQGFGTDIFLLSVDSLGSVVWAKSFGSSGYDTTMGTVHFNYADSTILLVGTHTDDFHYGPGSTDFLSLFNGAGQSVAFLKIKENGNVVKAKTSTEFGLGFQFMTDVQQNDTSFILSGSFGGNINIPKKNGSGDTTIAGLPNQGCVISLDHDFKFNFLTFTPQYIYKMELDSIGNIYGVGSYEWSSNSNWYLNTSLIKLSPNGILKFAKVIKTKSTAYAKYSYLNIISNNNISFTTHSSDTTLFDNINLYTSPLCVWNTHPQFEYFSLRMDSLGNMTNIIPYEVGTGMLNGVDFNMNKLGESYFTIPFTGTVSANSNTYTSNGGTDVLLYALDVNANFNWVQSFGSVGEDYCNSITFDNNNNPVLHGTFESTISIGQNARTASGPINITSNGGKDVFYAKINRTAEIPTSISKNNLGNDLPISVFPNPSSSKLYIKIKDNNVKYQFELFNTLGQRSFEKTVDSGLNEIDVSKLESGIYSYKIYNENYKANGKLVVVH